MDNTSQTPAPMWVQIGFLVFLVIAFVVVFVLHNKYDKRKNDDDEPPMFFPPTPMF